jgi:hypothetical protein
MAQAGFKSPPRLDLRKRFRESVFCDFSVISCLSPQPIPIGKPEEPAQAQVGVRPSVLLVSSTASNRGDLKPGDGKDCILIDKNIGEQYCIWTMQGNV